MCLIAGGFPGGDGGAPRGPPQLPLMYAEWAPTGSGIAYVFSNNIFYRSSPTADDVTLTESGPIFVLGFFLDFLQTRKTHLCLVARLLLKLLDHKLFFPRYSC